MFNSRLFKKLRMYLGGRPIRNAVILRDQCKAIKLVMFVIKLFGVHTTVTRNLRAIIFKKLLPLKSLQM